MTALEGAKAGLIQAIAEYESQKKKDIKLQDTIQLTIANALVAIAEELHAINSDNKSRSEQ